MNRALAVAGAVLVLALAGYAGTVTWLLQRERTRATSAAKAGQEAAMGAAGAVVRKPATAADVRDAAKPVQAQVDRVVAACPAVQTTEVVTWRVDPVPVPPQPAPVEAASPATLPPAAPVTEIQVRGTEARLETAEGTVAAVGEIEIWRIRPEPEELLGRRPWRAEMSRFVRTESAISKSGRWGFAPVLTIAHGRLGAGVLALSPAVDVAGARIELVGGLAASGGVRTSVLGAVLRW